MLANDFIQVFMNENIRMVAVAISKENQNGLNTEQQEMHGIV